MNTYTDLEILYKLRDHFKKHFDHAENWGSGGGGASAHGGCLFTLATKLTDEFLLFPARRAHALTTDIFGPYFFNQMGERKHAYMKLLERRIAELEEHSIPTREGTVESLPETTFKNISYMAPNLNPPVTDVKPT